MILCLTTLILVGLILILSYNKLIVNCNKVSIILLPGMINFMLGFSIVRWILKELITKEDYIFAILAGIVSFLIITSIILNNNTKKPITIKSSLLNETATIKSFILKSHKHYIYLAECNGYTIFVSHTSQLNINTNVILKSYLNNQYFI